jgi:hypothetical protein
MIGRETLALIIAVLTIVFGLTIMFLAKRRRSSERGRGNLRIDLTGDDSHGR